MGQDFTITEQFTNGHRFLIGTDESGKRIGEFPYDAEKHAAKQNMDLFRFEYGVAVCMNPEDGSARQTDYFLAECYKRLAKDLGLDLSCNKEMSAATMSFDVADSQSVVEPPLPSGVGHRHAVKRTV